MSKAILRIFLYLLILCIPLLFVLLLGNLAVENGLYALGKAAALVGVMIIILQAVLAARFRWISRAFGFDRIIRYHKYLALCGVLLLLAHPVLLAAGGAGWSLLYTLTPPFPILLGKIGLLFLLVNIIISALQPKTKLQFEKWRVIHDILSPALVLATFLHGFLIGSDIIGFLTLKIIWILLFVLEAFVLIFHLFVRPRLLAKNPYRVSEVTAENDRVWTLKMIPSSGRVLDYLPGQFQFITLKRRKGLPEEEHHFTISSSPTNTSYISSTIKALGDFTSTIGETKIGDTAVIHAPFGRFSYPLYKDEIKLMFIAGGIGITPVISMLRHLRDTDFGNEAVLLYGNKTEKDIVFRDELSEYERQFPAKFKVVHVLEKPETGWTGESGLITQDMIEKYCFPERGNVGFYIVGPDTLRESAVNSLHAIGIRNKRIHTEIFKLI